MQNMPTQQSTPLAHVRGFKRILATGGVALALIAATLGVVSPAAAASGMSCTTSLSGNGYWFYCNGTNNLAGTWTQVTCSNYLTNTNWNVRETESATRYAPWSFGEFTGCPSGWFIGVSNPQWGPK